MWWELRPRTLQPCPCLTSLLFNSFVFGLMKMVEWWAPTITIIQGDVYRERLKCFMRLSILSGSVISFNRYVKITHSFLAYLALAALNRLAQMRPFPALSAPTLIFSLSYRGSCLLSSTQHATFSQIFKRYDLFYMIQPVARHDMVIYFVINSCRIKLIYKAWIRALNASCWGYNGFRLV